MNEVHGITPANLLRTLPDVLRKDRSMLALAAAVADALAARPGEIERLLIYNRIDSLPEPLLDMLAHDFKVDWWDANYTLAEKRQTLKDSWYVHRILGTKGAVETAISAIYPDTQVSEWFEYGGVPYHFRLLITATAEQVTSEKHRRVLDRVIFYKNLRSYLDAIIYTHKAAYTATTHHAGAFSEHIQAYFTSDEGAMPAAQTDYHAGAVSEYYREAFTE